MSYRKAFTVTDDDIFIATIGIVERQILKIRGDVWEAPESTIQLGWLIVGEVRRFA